MSMSEQPECRNGDILYLVSTAKGQKQKHQQGVSGSVWLLLETHELLWTHDLWNSGESLKYSHAILFFYIFVIMDPKIILKNTIIDVWFIAN